MCESCVAKVFDFCVVLVLRCSDGCFCCVVEFLDVLAAVTGLVVLIVVETVENVESDKEGRKKTLKNRKIKNNDVKIYKPINLTPHF